MWNIPPQKLSIIVPVYNESKYLKTLFQKIESIKLPITKEIIIIESGSTDRSREIVQELSLQHNYKTIYEDSPSGKGSAVRKGIEAATGDILMIQDADLEYEPSDYPELINPILENKAMFVLGSRHLGAGTWKFRSYDQKWYAWILNYGSYTYSFLFYLLYDIFLTDPQTMFKVFHRDCIKDIKFVSKRFDLDWEIVCKLVRSGHIPIEIPVHFNGRSHNEGKKIHIWPDAWLSLIAIIKFRFQK